MAWRAGAAEVVITPPVGVEMDGYGARKSGSIGVHDDLLARALVLDDGSRRTAVVTCDVLFVDGPTVAAVRAAVEQRWGIPPERVLVAATHTHQGPKGLTGFRAAADSELIAIMTRQIVGAVDAATRRSTPARLMAGTGKVDSISLNRRFEDRPVDTALHVLRVEGEDGRLRAALLNFACHPTVLNYDNLLLSQDWPGFACPAVKALWGDVPVLFANGACGDINPIKIGETFEDARRAGTIVGAVRTESGTAPWGRNARRAHPDGYPTEVQYLKLGDAAAIVTAPGELATEIGFEMAALCPSAETFVVGYANDGIGYLMPDEVHAEGGYEAGRTLFSRGVKSRLLEAAAAAVAALS